jgi:hypothetical protein
MAMGGAEILVSRGVEKAGDAGVRSQIADSREPQMRGVAFHAP